MPGYDRSYGGGWGARRGGYEWNRAPRETMGMGRPWNPHDVQYGRWDGPGGYDRGVYGGGYEGPAGRYAEGPARRGWGGYADDFDGWQAGYARGPFLPEQAYRRHPELDREPGPRGARWGYEMDDTGWDLDDRDILEAVRQRLYDDVWLDVDRIDVEVEDGVVTLRGEVDDFMEARYAWDDAWETEGVRGVVNLLTVRVDQADPQPHGDVLPQTTHGTSSEPQGIGNRE